MGEAAAMAGGVGGSGLIGEEAKEDTAAIPRKATNAAGRITIERMDTLLMGYNFVGDQSNPNGGGLLQQK